MPASDFYWRAGSVWCASSVNFIDRAQCIFMFLSKYGGYCKDFMLHTYSGLLGQFICTSDFGLVSLVETEKKWKVASAGNSWINAADSSAVCDWSYAALLSSCAHIKPSPWSVKKAKRHRRSHQTPLGLQPPLAAALLCSALLWCDVRELRWHSETRGVQVQVNKDRRGTAHASLALFCQVARLQGDWGGERLRPLRRPARRHAALPLL